MPVLDVMAESTVMNDVVELDYTIIVRPQQAYLLVVKEPASLPAKHEGATIA